MIRLDRCLVALGVGSRSQVQKLIRAGAVAAAGETLRDPAAQIAEGTPICVRGEPLDTRLARTVLLDKPAGLLTAARDRKQPTVMNLLPPAFGTLGCMPVGRLDKDTTGLLLLTTDGELAHRLLSPARHVDKTYLAEVDGPLTAREAGRMAEGLLLDGETEPTRPARLEILESRADFARAYLTIHEGRFHQVKRMFEAVGRTVTALRRVSFGPLRLEGDPRPGFWRDLTAEEERALRRAAGLEE